MGRKGSLPSSLSRGAMRALVVMRWLLLATSLACARPTAVQPGAEQPRLELLTVDADVWAFHMVARASLHARSPAKACTFSVGASSTPAQLEGTSSQALLSLEEGENLIAAHCVLVDGHALHSEPVRLRVRLRDAPAAHAHAQLEEGELLLDGSASIPSERSGAPLVEYRWWQVAT